MARDIDEGLQDFLRRAAQHKLLTADEEKLLGRAVQRGDSNAKEKLLMSNIRLVVSVAREFRGRGLEFADLIQAGTIGLNRAVEKFDPERGYRFTTYAMLWIKQAIQRELSKGGSAIRLPPLVADRRAKLRALQAKFPEETLEMLAVRMDMTVRQLEDALNAAEVVTSLDRPAHEESGAASSMGELIGDMDAVDPSLVSDPDALYRAMYDLTDEERKCVVLRFGLGCEPHAVEAIASITGFSRSRVNDTIRSAMDSLRDALN